MFFTFEHFSFLVVEIFDSTKPIKLLHRQLLSGEI